MKRAIAAAALTAAALVGAGDANADTASYLQTLERMGISVTDPHDFVKIGQWVCSALHTTDRTPFQLAYRMHMDAEVPMEFTSTLVLSAVYELCPQFKHLLLESPNHVNVEVYA